jgi:hypothetical protein
MTGELLTQIETFLRSSGFDVSDATAPFAFVAQNTSILVFVVEANTDLDQTVTIVTTILASPFRSKQFGPKSMEMYCIFAADEATPISSIERWEQNLKFCRKVFVTNSHQIDIRLSFLQPLNESLTGSLDVDSMFWSQMDPELTANEVELLKSLGSSVKTTDELLERLANTK